MNHYYQKIDLSGEWKFRLAGFKKIQESKKRIDIFKVNLPGSLNENKIGNDIDLNTPWTGFTGGGGWKRKKKYAPYREPGNIKVPFWLQPLKYYKGKAVYTREIRLSQEWKGKQIYLFLERCHWKSTVWINKRKIGTQNSLSTPHQYNITQAIKKNPQKFILDIEIDNNYLIGVGINAHSITDHTQTNWNGIIGKIELQIKDPIHISNIEIIPKVESNFAKMNLEVQNFTNSKHDLSLTIKSDFKNKIIGEEKENNIVLGKGTNNIKIEYPLSEEYPHWNEFTPDLIHIQIVLKGKELNQKYDEYIGLRHISQKDHQFHLDGKKVILRGTLDCCTFPKTGYPSIKKEKWIQIFKICKNHGINHIRFHSWCPPEVTFEVADELGLYLQPECGIWRGLTTIKEIADELVYPFLIKETKKIIKNFANHPSFMFFCHGNESWNLQRTTIEKWVKFAKKNETRFLVSGSAHFKLTKYDDYHQVGPGSGFHMRYHKRFNKSPPSTAKNYNDMIKTKPVPLVAHEIGQWCVLPNLQEMKKYTGCLKPKNYEIVEDFMRENKIYSHADELFMASGKFQTLIYKESIEAMLRTKKIGGYQLLGLNDFPGQGTALVGVLDAFWEEKGYVTPEEYKRFNGPIVILAEMEKRVWKNSETFKAKIKISQFSNAPLQEGVIQWKIMDPSKSTVEQGSIIYNEIPIGLYNLQEEIIVQLTDFQTPLKYVLEISILDGEVYNNWDIWVYPTELEDPSIDDEKFIITEKITEAITELKKGKNVLYLPEISKIPHKTFGSFEPIFWNTAWFPNQKMHTLGQLTDKEHPALRDFPTDTYCNWQWWEIINESKPIVMDGLLSKIKPIIQPIDDWNTSRKLGLLFVVECRKGKLLVCAIDIKKDLEKRIVASQLKYSLLKYITSKNFKPQHKFTLEQIGKLFEKYP